MNHDRLSPVHHSNRSASRRLHRRLTAATLTIPGTCTADEAFATQAPQMLLPLAEVSVHKAGMLELMAAKTRIAELEKSLADARAAATIDPLTGALNRRGFDKAFRRECSRFARTHHKSAGLALALLDLDDFKLVNDRYGHHTGDQALIHVVQILRAEMRPSDVISRFGGEEFVLLLPDTALSDAEAVLARFQLRLAKSPIPQRNIALTFSAGVVHQQTGESLEASLQRADQATYAAKRAGKNCVVTG
ncbi:MAG: GGDEF domain-containing protein [Pseudomonadota bacterium]